MKFLLFQIFLIVTATALLNTETDPVPGNKSESPELSTASQIQKSNLEALATSSAHPNQLQSKHGKQERSLHQVWRRRLDETDGDDFYVDDQSADDESQADYDPSLNFVALKEFIEYLNDGISQSEASQSEEVNLEAIDIEDLLYFLQEIQHLKIEYYNSLVPESETIDDNGDYDTNSDNVDETCTCLEGEEQCDCSADESYVSEEPDVEDEESNANADVTSESERRHVKRRNYRRVVVLRHTPKYIHL